MRSEEHDDMPRISVNVPGLGHGGQPIPNASRINDLVWSGGVAGVDPSVGRIPADASAEVDQMFANVESIVCEAGGSVGDIIRMSVFTPDRTVIVEALNKAWVRMFPDPGSRPARHVSTQSLASTLRVQCEFIAVVKS